MLSRSAGMPSFRTAMHHPSKPIGPFYGEQEAQARRYQEEQQFPAGSMGPKIQAAIEFVEADARNRAIIIDVDGLIPALDGKEGTTVVAS
jgi:carbamate kinase